MIYRRNSKHSYWVFLIIYILINHLIFNIIDIFGLWLIAVVKESLDFKIWYLWWTDMWLFVLLNVLAIIPPSIYKIASNVDLIEIDETNNTIKICYTPLFVNKKEMIFDINDELFALEYTAPQRSKSKLFKLFLVSKDTSLIFLYKKKVFITIRDTSGWTHQQIEDIAKHLFNLKKLNEMQELI